MCTTRCGPREARGKLASPRAGKVRANGPSSKRRSPVVTSLATSARTCRPSTTLHVARVPRCGIPVARRPPESAAAPVTLRFPPSVFPLWKPPFQIPPFRGLHQRGQTAGGNRTAAFMENGAKPPRSRRFSSAPFSAAALRVAPPRRRLINPIALDPSLGVSALVGPKPAARVHLLARFRPFMDAAFAALITAPGLRGGLLLRSQQPP